MPRTTAPKLSVIIACRDAQDFLGVQLAALARQACPVPWEVLICDNGSSDHTVALAESWKGRLPLRIIEASDVLGAGPARNAGVANARGEWIGFCDADDEVGEDWLATLCAALAEHPFVAGRLEGTRLNSPQTLRSRPLDQQTGLQFSSAEVGLPHAASCNLGIHRSVFEHVGGFDPAVRYLQDTDLCWRVQLAGYPLVFVPGLEVHVRLRSTLRAMFQQGRNYGASQARLTRRYAHREPEPALVTVGSAEATAAEVPEAHAFSAPAAPGAQRPSNTTVRAMTGGIRLARHFVSHRSSLGYQVWQIGWHLGHRS